MIQIFINNKLAALKKDFNFEYVSENRLFTGADAYTLEMEFPLKDCPQNIEIFGRLFRKDVSPKNIIFDCEIRDRNFFKAGSVTVTGINDTSVKVQFLEGRSAQNFDMSFDNTYINELDLGGPDIINHNAISPKNAMNPAYNNYKAVCLPWVMGSNESTIIHNEMVKGDGDDYVWGKDVINLTWQPYLLYIAKAICECEAVNYAFDFSAWESSPRFRNLIVCNTLSDAWDIEGFARALPHWTVDEFFDNLELLLGGEFTINHKERSIKFEFSKNVDEAIAPVCLDKVVDEFSAEVSTEESKCDYIELRNFKYKDQNDEMWNFYSCRWYVELVKEHDPSKPNFVKFLQYETLRELIAATRGFSQWVGASGRGSIINSVFYVKEFDMYYILRYYEREPYYDGAHYWRFNCFLQPINSFGPAINSTGKIDDFDKVEYQELNFVPVSIDYTDKEHGVCMFLYPSSSSENNSTKYDPEDPTIYNKDFWPSIEPVDIIKNGEQDNDKPEYFNSILVAYWDGTADKVRGPEGLLLPFPYVENVNIDSEWNYKVSDFSLRLNDGSIKNRYRNLNLQVDKKYTFKFIAEKVPNPRAIFIIRGKRYLCESLTVNFTAEGKSDLIKGVFWAIEEG